MKSRFALRRSHGFTLLELMIVVAIIGILASIAMPKFAELMVKSRKGPSRGAWGPCAPRWAFISRTTRGKYPADLTVLTANARYLKEMPFTKGLPLHSDSSAVALAMAADDSAGWTYNATPGDANNGMVMVNCTHTDTKGSIWSSY